MYQHPNQEVEPHGVGEDTSAVIDSGATTDGSPTGVETGAPSLPPRRSGVMGAAAAPVNAAESPPRETATRRAAAHALTTGKRSDLLRYLRLRRTP